MAATSNRTSTITFGGDVVSSHTVTAAQNTDSPASVEIKTLASGANTITVPTGGTVPTACTIVPPVANTTNITLKGVTGDTGIQLHDSDPSTISLDSTVTSFVLTAAAQITDVRLYWS